MFGLSMATMERMSTATYPEVLPPGGNPLRAWLTEVTLQTLPHCTQHTQPEMIFLKLQRLTKMCLQVI